MRILFVRFENSVYAQAFVVGSGGVLVEEFLSWDIGKLIEG